MVIRHMNELRGLMMWHGAFPRLARLLIASSVELGRILMAFHNQACRPRTSDLL